MRMLCEIHNGAKLRDFLNQVRALAILRVGLVFEHRK